MTRVGSPVPGLGVSDVDHVVSVNVHAARPAELEPLRDKLAVLIEDLDSVVLAIADKQPSSRIEGNRVDDIEFTRSHAFTAPGLDELSILVELHDASVASGCTATAVSVRNEDVAVRSDCDFGRLIELVEARSGNARLAERHQELSFRTELQHLLALSGYGSVVGDPNVTVFVHGDFVGAHDHALSETLQQLTRRVELEDRIEERIGARRTARARCATPVNDPDRLSVRPGGNAGR